MRYFLFVFGNTVEDFLGRVKFGLLVLFAALGGDILAMSLEPRSHIPSIGASGGISGLIAFYALQFLHAAVLDSDSGVGAFSRTIHHPRFRSAQDAQSEAAAVFERFDGGGDFEDGIADGGQAVGFVGAGEEFGFHNAGPISDGDEFHWLTGDLVKQALLDDEATGDDLFADVFAEAIDGAICVPRDVRIKFEGMTADGIAEQFCFPTQALEALGFIERDGGKAAFEFEIFGR